MLAFAIGYARDGFPMTPGIARAIRALRAVVDDVGGALAAERARLRNPLLADTYERLARSGGATREARIDAARDAWYRGFVAEAIVAAVAVPAVDSSGEAHAGVLSGDDLAAFSASYEEPVSFDFRGWTVFKTGPWGQGPVFLQQLALLDGLDLGPFLGVEHLHGVIECAKLAFADREAFYGDSAPVPLDALLSRAYADERRALVGAEASGELRPGLGGRLPSVRAGAGAAARASGEPTRAATPATSTSPTAGATSCRATPSGGWLQSSPAIDGLGFCLGTRAQMFWLEDGLPASLVGGRRPRTTLSPSLGLRDDGTVMAFGTPGGDQQDQWSLEFFLAHALFGLDLQAAIDAPMFHTTHFPSSFYPREAEPRRVEVEGRVPAATVAALRARGHDVLVGDDWVARAAERDRALARRAAARRREPARDAGLRRRSLARNAPALGNNRPTSGVSAGCAGLWSSAPSSGALGNPKEIPTPLGEGRADRRCPAASHSIDDTRLARRVAQGDATAFEVLYDRHHRALLSFCRHMLGLHRGRRGRAPADLPARPRRAAGRSGP